MAIQNKKKRVLHIAPTPFFSDRGCHMRILMMAKELKQLGYESLICTYHHGRNLDDVKISRIGNIKNYTQTSAGPNPYKLWADIKLLCLVIREIRRYQPDVIHAHIHEGVLIGFIAKLFYFRQHIPLLADMQGSLVGELETFGFFKRLPFLRPLFNIIEWLVLTIPRKIVCSSIGSYTIFKERLKIKEDKMEIIHDSGPPFKHITEKQKARLRKQFNLPADKLIVCYTGALQDGKGLKELTEIITLSHKQKLNLHFLVVGYPEAELREHCSKNNINNVTLTGRQDFSKLPGFLSISHIALDPKRSGSGEASGKIINYMAASLPILAFKTENNQYFLGQDTRMANDMPELISILAGYIENPKQLPLIAKRINQRFLDNFTEEKCLQVLAKVYNNITPSSQQNHYTFKRL